MTIASSYRMSSAVVGRIVRETCVATQKTVIAKVYLKAPPTQENWKNISHGFLKNWNFPNCIGAIDGKHI